MVVCNIHVIPLLLILFHLCQCTCYPHKISLSYIANALCHLPSRPEATNINYAGLARERWGKLNCHRLVCSHLSKNQFFSHMMASCSWHLSCIEQLPRKRRYCKSRKQCIAKSQTSLACPVKMFHFFVWEPSGLKMWISFCVDQSLCELY